MNYKTTIADNHPMSTPKIKHSKISKISIKKFTTFPLPNIIIEPHLEYKFEVQIQEEVIDKNYNIKILEESKTSSLKKAGSNLKKNVADFSGVPKQRLSNVGKACGIIILSKEQMNRKPGDGPAKLPEPPSGQAMPPKMGIKPPPPPKIRKPSAPEAPPKPPLPDIFYYNFYEQGMEKKWNNPKEDITDYFNYGMNEETWKIYANKVRDLADSMGKGFGQRTPENSFPFDKNLPIDIGGFGEPHFSEVKDVSFFDIMRKNKERFFLRHLLAPENLGVQLQSVIESDESKRIEENIMGCYHAVSKDMMTPRHKPKNMLTRMAVMPPNFLKNPSTAKILNMMQPPHPAGMKSKPMPPGYPSLRSQHPLLKGPNKFKKGVMPPPPAPKGSTGAPHGNGFTRNPTNPMAIMVAHEEKGPNRKKPSFMFQGFQRSGKGSQKQKAGSNQKIEIQGDTPNTLKITLPKGAPPQPPKEEKFRQVEDPVITNPIIKENSNSNSNGQVDSQELKPASGNKKKKPKNISVLTKRVKQNIKRENGNEKTSEKHEKVQNGSNLKKRVSREGKEVIKEVEQDKKKSSRRMRDEPNQRRKEKKDKTKDRERNKDKERERGSHSGKNKKSKKTSNHSRNRNRNKCPKRSLSPAPEYIKTKSDRSKKQNREESLKEQDKSPGTKRQNKRKRSRERGHRKGQKKITLQEEGGKTRIISNNPEDMYVEEDAFSRKRRHVQLDKLEKKKTVELRERDTLDIRQRIQLRKNPTKNDYHITLNSGNKQNWHRRYINNNNKKQLNWPFLGNQIKFLTSSIYSFLSLLRQIMKFSSCISGHYILMYLSQLSKQINSQIDFGSQIYF